MTQSQSAAALPAPIMPRKPFCSTYISSAAAAAAGTSSSRRHPLPASCKCYKCGEILDLHFEANDYAIAAMVNFHGGANFWFPSYNAPTLDFIRTLLNNNTTTNQDLRSLDPCTEKEWKDDLILDIKEAAELGIYKCVSCRKLLGPDEYDFDNEDDILDDQDGDNSEDGHENNNTQQQ